MNVKEKWNDKFNYIRTRYKRIRIGLRTIKTATAVIISMLIIASMGLSASKMIFAMLGAMATMENTFKDSIEACLTQIVGMIFGTILGIVFVALPFPFLLDAGIGIILVITLYNIFQIRYSPTLPCLIIVTVCTTPDIVPLEYALGRLSASGIGLIVGLLINTLIFPYDNSNKIHATIDYLDKELLLFLEDMFDGDNHLPNTQKMNDMIEDMQRQLKIFSGQSLILHKAKKRRQLEMFKTCVGKERELIAHMQVLSKMKCPGRLNEQNRERLKKSGAVIRDERRLEEKNTVLVKEQSMSAEKDTVLTTEETPLYQMTEADIITNYHVEQLLLLRLELMTELKIIIQL